jgi:hypothetical protein
MHAHAYVGCAEQWYMVSRFSHLMAVAVEGRFAGSEEKLAHGFEIFTLNGSSS